MLKQKPKLLLILVSAILLSAWLFGSTQSISQAENQPLPDGHELNPLQTAEPTHDSAESFSPDNMPATLEITGTIRNGTANGSVPDNLVVNLFSIDFGPDGQPVNEIASAEILSKGTTFSLDALPVSINAGVVAQVIYNDVPFVSEIIPAHHETDGIVELNVTIYEITTDTSDVYFSEIWYIVGASPEEDLSEIYNWYFIRNDTDQVIYDGENGGIHIPLPQGAFGLRIEDTSGRFQIDESDEVPILIDYNPLRPGEEDQLIVNYLLSYNDDELNFSQSLDYPVNRLAIYVARIFDLEFEADGFIGGDITELRGLGYYNRYVNDAGLPAHETLTFYLSGTERLTDIEDDTSIPDDNMSFDAIFTDLFHIVEDLMSVLGFIYRFLP